MSGTQFFSYADFLGSIFNVSAYFNGCRFYGFADFEGARFDYANFMATFEDIVDFRSTFLRPDLSFGKRDSWHLLVSVAHGSGATQILGK